MCEFKPMGERDLKLWAAGLLKADGRKITDASMTYFLEKVGNDMENIRTEIEKLIAYTQGREVVEAADIDAVCTQQITGKIFQLMDQIAMQKPKEALGLYHDLLLLREKPMSILFLMLRQFNILMQVKQLSKEGMSNADIAQKAGIPPFAAGKYLAQARAFSAQALRDAVQFGVDTEARVKSGQINEQIAVELMLVHLSAL